MALSPDDQQAIDTTLGGGLARLVLLEKQCRELRAAVQALSAAQRNALSTTYPTVWTELQDVNAVLAGPTGPRVVVVGGVRWLRRERLAEAIEVLVRDRAADASVTVADLRAMLLAAGGTVGVVESAPTNEDAV